MTWITAAIMISVGAGLASLAQASPSPRPPDWISHSIPLSTQGQIEVIELPAPTGEIRGIMLMIPGFFQNANSFDLIPEKQISIARYFMAKYSIKIYLLNARGLGLASSGKHLSLDDFAIDDIPTAIDWVAHREKSKIFVFGHSQGGIMLQASLSGLDRLNEHDHGFVTETAIHRQQKIRGIALSGANVAMTIDDPKSGLLRLGKLGKPLRKALTHTLDRIRISDLVTRKIFRPFAFVKPWEFLYHRANTTRDAQLALYQRTLENSWSGVIVQYIDGINQKGISALNREPRDRYADYLKNISVPAVAVTYELDPMAEPEPTYRDDFVKIGSIRKKFFMSEGQGHEDFMMNATYHADWDAPLKFLLDL